MRCYVPAKSESEETDGWRPQPRRSRTSSTVSSSTRRTGARPPCSTRRPARRSPRRPTPAPRTSTARSRPRSRAFETLGRRRRRPSARPRCSRSPTLIEEHADELAELESANAGKPLAAVKEDEIGTMADQLPLLRRRGAHARGQGRRRVPRGLHVDDPPRAGRRRRPDRAVELPADDGRLEDRPGAGGRQHDRPQAGADDARSRRSSSPSSRPSSCPRACSTSSPAATTPARRSSSTRTSTSSR